MSIDTKLENPQGTLLNVSKKINLSTVQHAREIQRDRQTDTALRDMWFWTADFPLYTMEKGQATLYFADGKHNLAFQHLDDAVEQLRTKNNYFPNDSDIGSVINAKSTLKVKLSDLKLERYDDEWSYFEIDTAKYSKLNKSQRVLAERVHGKGKAFDKTMKMLRDPKGDDSNTGIQKTRVYVLNPTYVKNTLEKNNAKSIARVSALDNFGDDSDFDASNRSVGNNGRRLRGVPLGAEGANAPKINPYEIALNTVLTHEKEILGLMNTKPAYATKINSLLGKYISSKA